MSQQHTLEAKPLAQAPPACCQTCDQSGRGCLPRMITQTFKSLHIPSPLHPTAFGGSNVPVLASPAMHGSSSHTGLSSLSFVRGCSTSPTRVSRRLARAKHQMRARRKSGAWTTERQGLITSAAKASQRSARNSKFGLNPKPYTLSASLRCHWCKSHCSACSASCLHVPSTWNYALTCFILLVSTNRDSRSKAQ